MEALHDVAILVNEKLLKIPLHVAAFEIRVVSQPLEEGVLFLVEDGYLDGDGKLDFVRLQRGLDVPGPLRLLRTELVARKAQDFQTLVPVGVIQLDQLCVVPISEVS